MNSKIVTVTPELACEWLKRNTRNRPINRHHVDRLIRDLRAGRWVLTHQGIAFASDHSLIDGQHRLTAIVESGIPARLVVFEDAPSDSILGMDQAQSRSGRDVVSINNRVNLTSKEQAVVMAMVRGSNPKPVTQTAQEQAAAVLEYIEAAKFAIAIFPTNKTGLKRAQVLAVIARASYTVDHDVLRRFCEVLQTGISTSEVDTTVIVLRDYLLGGPPPGGNGTQAIEVYRKTERALDAYRKGEKLSKLYAARAEMFPVPSSNDEPSTKPLKVVG